jgi:hypothetical protein
MGAPNEADLIDNLYGEVHLEHLFALALAYYPFIKIHSLCKVLIFVNVPLDIRHWQRKYLRAFPLSYFFLQKQKKAEP